MALDSGAMDKESAEGPPYAFDPDWTVAPGETVKETLEELGLTPQDLGLSPQGLGLSPAEVQGILDGDIPITENAAARLERVTDVPAALWLRLDASYWEDLARGKTRVR